MFSDLSFKFFSCYQGAIEAHGTESLRKDVAEWKKLGTILLMFMLSFFLLQLDLCQSGRIGSLPFFPLKER